MRALWDDMAESKSDWERRMKAEHGNVSQKQLDNWWRMKRLGEGRAGGGSAKGDTSGGGTDELPAPADGPGFRRLS